MCTPEQVDFINLLITVLRDHEKMFDKGNTEFKETLETLKDAVGVLHKGEKLGWGTARGLATALAYSMNSELKDVDINIRKLFVSEFFHGLNRRHILDSETYDLIDEVCGLLQ